jgi:hypothetical protein
MIKIAAQLLHVVICACMAYGILFSKTPVQAYIVLANLVVIFLGLRLFKGCMLTEHEDGFTTQIGKEFMLEDPNSVSTHNFEEVAVGFALVLQVIRTTVISLKLHEILF